MKLVYGSPALSLLLRMKVRGALRRQWRRLRTPKGFLLTLLGVGAFGTWMTMLLLSLLRPGSVRGQPYDEMHARLFGMMLFFLSLSSALTNRGLYLPRTEIERLFSAPVSRADLVRYRLLSNGLRSLLGGLVMGLFGAHRMPSAPLGFAGILLSMQTLPVVNQIIAIALGGLEQGAARILKRLGSLLLVGALVVLGGLAFTLATDRSPGDLPLIGAWMRALDVGGDPLAHPALGALTTPFVPWARMVSAESARDFVPWFALCLVLHAGLLELCARIPLDFRELSLATSARAAARVARVRMGGGVSSTRASAGSARLRIPWLLGHSPAGAIGWRKVAGMVRKARGAFWVALIALGSMLVVVRLMARQWEDEKRLLAPFVITALGTIYLCSGLRFDFREELERMDAVRAWPLPAGRVFWAMLLPEVLLVSALVTLTVLIDGALSGTLTAHVGGVLLCLPLLVFAWAAADNIVFLYAPVRFVPGQDGFVQNAGRRMFQMALLVLLVGPAVALGVAGGLGATFLASELGASELLAFLAGYATAFIALAGADALLARLGGFVLRRFDVARDRG